MSEIYHVKVEPNGAIPAFNADFGRVNIILGANGSGKSKLLGAIAGNSHTYFGADFAPVFVEGGRAIEIPISVGLDGNTMGVFANPKQARKNYNDSKRGTLSNRIRQAFVTLRAMETEEKTRHSDEAEAWSMGDRKAPFPARPVPPFERLENLFREIFPQLSLDITDANQLYIRNGNAHYPVSNLSDGEKQIFTLLADIVALRAGRSVFLIDEPELNLHPSLAESFWASVEDAYPDSIFVYATHSLSFALRPTVDAIYAVGHGRIDLGENLEAIELRPFLGSMPGIIRSKQSLFVEGEDLSFDRPFYKWLLGSKGPTVSAVGSSTEVVAAASRSGIWQQLSSAITVCGVIDRDFAAEPIATQNIATLKYHEAESYLCHPSLVVALANVLGNSDQNIVESDVVDKLVEVAKRRVPFVVCQRVSTRCAINLRLSLERSGLSKIHDIGELRSKIALEGSNEAAKAQSVFDPKLLDEMITQEERACNNAIAQRDVEALLQIFEGKRPLAAVAKMAGCPTPMGMLSAATKHFQPETFPHIKALKDQLGALFIGS